MFETTTEDHVALDGYPYGWRWTDATRRAILPDDRARILPLTSQKAQAAWTYAEAFQGQAYWDRFDEQAALAVDGRGSPALDAQVCDWLRAQLPPADGPLFVSWSQQQAVETDLETFLRYWDTFCYPVEDVVIWPQEEQWVLLFDYQQRFYYAVARG